MCLGSEVSVGASYINFLTELFSNLVIILLGTCKFNKSLFPEISFLRIECTVITFPNKQIFFLPLNSQIISKILSNIYDGVRY